MMGPFSAHVAFIGANVQGLLLESFPDNIYDLYTIAFGITNVTSIPDVLREVYRVLNLGGTFPRFEFTRSTNPSLAH